MDVSTMMALYSIEDDLTDDLLKDAVRKIRNVKP
jgi:hypothetical protein